MTLPFWTPAFWQFEAKVAGQDLLVPDGCFDVISVTRKGCARADAPETAVFVSPMDMAPRVVSTVAGARLEGIRLPPGCPVSQSLAREFAHAPQDAGAQIEAQIAQHMECLEAVAALAAGTLSIPQVAAQAGLSRRSLERRFARLDLPAPAYWVALGRARRMALSLQTSAHLADLAAQMGYADQAHMTRESKRWLGHTPRQLRAAPQVLAMVSQSGLANWAR